MASLLQEKNPELAENVRNALFTIGLLRRTCYSTALLSDDEIETAALLIRDIAVSFFKLKIRAFPKLHVVSYHFISFLRK